MRTLAAVLSLAGCSSALGPSSTPPTDDAVAAEIVALHDFFTGWFRGEVPNDDPSFAKFPDALAPGFVIVSPTGTLSDRDTVLAGVRGAHGSWGPDDSIRISNVAVRIRTDETIVATYEEWQRREGTERGRLSTVVFDSRLRWQHVHETWLPTTQ